ncbi:MAG TPA: hypothetical protein VM511_03470, partial [Luteolibacter sp.]|nr:hypothetical protein [Luteolibacter sp.]
VALATLTSFAAVVALAFFLRLALAITGTGVTGVRFGSTGFTTLGLFRDVRLALGARRTDRLFVEADGFQDFLPEREFRRRILAWRTIALRAEFLGPLLALVTAAILIPVVVIVVPSVLPTA